MKKTRWIQGITLFILVGFITILVVNLNKNESVTVGDEAYDFALEDRTGEIYQLSDYRGKPVVLNFFTTWCESCHEVAPSLIEFEKEYGDEFQIFTIVRAESERTLEKYLERTGYEDRLYIFDYDMEVSDRYGIVGQPETVIIDENGMIVEHIVGPITGKELAKVMSNLQLL